MASLSSPLNLFEPPLPEGFARDPVCRMAVDPAKAEDKAEHAGKTYWFCCSGCQEMFVADPERYVAAESETGARLAQQPRRGLGCWRPHGPAGPRGGAAAQGVC